MVEIQGFDDFEVLILDVRLELELVEVPPIVLLKKVVSRW